MKNIWFRSNFSNEDNGLRKSLKRPKYFFFLNEGPNNIKKIGYLSLIFLF